MLSNRSHNSLSDTLTISVVVPVHNGGENFRHCLLSLTEAIPSSDEIIVIGDGDTDGSSGMAEALGAKVVRLPEPGGPARARNVGAARASGDIIVFVDADVVMCRDAIAQVRAAFTHESDLAAVFGSYDANPGATNFLSQYKNLLHHYMHQTASEEASTFWSGCGAIRRDVFLAIGGFDEHYRDPSVEDIELGYRLRRAGHRIRLCKAVQVKHLKRWGAFSLLESDFFHRALPWTELLLRDRCFINDLNLRLTNRVSVILTYAFLFCLISASWWGKTCLTVAPALMLSLLLLNAPLYRFFQQRRGLWFALRTIPWHWFYYAYSGLAFAIGTARYLSRTTAAQGSEILLDPEKFSRREAGPQ